MLPAFEHGRVSLTIVAMDSSGSGSALAFPSRFDRHASNLRARMPANHVVVKEKVSRNAVQGEADGMGSDVVSQRRGEPERMWWCEQKAELGDADAAGVREEEEDSLAWRCPTCGHLTVHRRLAIHA